MHGDGGRAAEQIIEAQRLGQLAGRHADALQRDARGRGRRRADAPVAAQPALRQRIERDADLPAFDQAQRTSAATSALARSAVSNAAPLRPGWPGASRAARRCWPRQRAPAPRAGTTRRRWAGRRRARSGTGLPAGRCLRSRRAPRRVRRTDRPPARARGPSSLIARRGSHSRSATSATPPARPGAGALPARRPKAPSRAHAPDRRPRCRSACRGGRPAPSMPSQASMGSVTPPSAAIAAGRWGWSHRRVRGAAPVR